MPEPKPTCLYPDEAEVAKLVLGKRAKDWPHKAKFLEDKFNLPRVDPLMGGRYWPAAQRFFDQRHRLAALSLDDGQLQPSSNIRIIPFPPDAR